MDPRHIVSSSSFCWSSWNYLIYLCRECAGPALERCSSGWYFPFPRHSPPSFSLFHLHNLFLQSPQIIIIKYFPTCFLFSAFRSLLHSDKERSTPMPMKNRPLWPLENVFRLIFILNFLRLLLRVEEVPLLLSFSSQMSEQGDFLVSDHPTPLSTPETPRGSLLNVHKSSSQVKKKRKTRK